MADNETLPPGYHALSLAPDWLKSLASWDERKQAEDPGRLNMSPWRYDPAQGKSVITTPKSLTGPVSGMATALMHMGDALHGVYFANEDQRGAVEDALNLAMSGMASGVAAPRGAVGMFAGAGSKTHDKVALDAARNYESQGESKDAIWHATGWFRGPDEKWKYEIPDHGATFKDGALATNQYAPDLKRLDYKWGDPPQRLGDVLDHPALFGAYPELADTAVRPMPFGMSFNTRGLTHNGDIYISGGKPEDMMSTLLHETQHIIQEKEGFGLGGTSAEWWKPEDAAALKSVQDQHREFQGLLRSQGYDPWHISMGHTEGDSAYRMSKEELARFKAAEPEQYDEFTKLIDARGDLEAKQRQAYQNYRNLAGEVEANNVQERLGQGLGSETPPWETTGYPSGPQNVRFSLWNGQDGAATIRVPPGRAQSKDLDITHLGGKPVDELEEVPAGAQAAERDFFHGTGAGPFSKFSNDRIGSGEGAQSYGYGHYVAQNPAVGKEYQMQVGGENGHLATVRVLPPDEDFLHFDKTLGEQPEVHQKLYNAGLVPDLESTAGMTGQDAHHMLQRQIYDSLSDQDYRGSLSPSAISQKTSEALYDARIPGVRYYDQHSRYSTTPATYSADLTPQQARGLDMLNASGTAKRWEQEPHELLPQLIQNYSDTLKLGQDSPFIYQGYDALKQKVEDLKSLDPSKLVAPARTHNYVVFNPDDMEITHWNGQPVEEVPNAQ